MFDALFIHEVTIRRSRGRTVRNKMTLVEPLKDDEPVKIKCRIELKGRRVYSREGTETVSDAAMMYRVKDIEPILSPEDIVVFKGKAYKVINLDSQQVLFDNRDDFARVDLSLSRVAIPEDTPGSPGD